MLRLPLQKANLHEKVLLNFESLYLRNRLTLNLTLASFISKVFMFIRFVFMYFVYIILDSIIDKELPSWLAWENFVKLHHTTFDPKLALQNRKFES